LTVLAPSERYYENGVRAAKKLTDWVWQVLLQVRRWLPTRRLVAVADSSFAVISLLARVQRLNNPMQEYALQRCVLVALRLPRA
jgi:hypothetical protein